MQWIWLAFTSKTLDSRPLPYDCLFNRCTVVQSGELPTCELHWSPTSVLEYVCTRCCADKPVVREYYHRAIHINVIIHLNTGINMLIIILFLKYHYLDHHFAIESAIAQSFKCLTAKDDEAKACVLSVVSCSVKRSSKVGIALGFLHQLNRQSLLCKHR